MTGRKTHYDVNTPHSGLHPTGGAARIGIGHVGPELSGMPGWADGGRTNIRRMILRTGYFVFYSIQKSAAGFRGIFIPESMNSPSPASQAESQLLEKTVSRISRTVQFIPQVLRDTSR